MPSPQVGDVSPSDNLTSRLHRLGAAYKRSREAAADDREPLVEAITEADRAGWTGQEIADATGLSRSGVLKMIVTAATSAPTVEVP
jgi:hypothetical protein